MLVWSFGKGKIIFLKKHKIFFLSCLYTIHMYKILTRIEEFKFLAAVSKSNMWRSVSPGGIIILG